MRKSHNLAFKRIHENKETYIILKGNELRISNTAGVKKFRHEKFNNLNPELIAILGVNIRRALEISEIEALRAGERTIRNWGIS